MKVAVYDLLTGLKVLPLMTLENVTNASGIIVKSLSRSMTTTVMLVDANESEE